MGGDYIGMGRGNQDGRLPRAAQFRKIAFDFRQKTDKYH